MAKNFLDEDGFLHKKRPKSKIFNVPPERASIPVNYYTDEELYADKGTVMVFDLEIYPNYFLAAFKNYTSHKVVTFELFPGREVFNYQKQLWVMHNFCLVGFNSNKFDLPIIWLALNGATIDDLSDAVMKIIVGNAMPRDIEAQYRFKMGKINHIDLIEVAPLTGSLKAYASRLHAPRIQDLPYDPMRPLTAEQAEIVKLYCVNDLDVTALLLKELEPQLTLRSSMSTQYGQDLRSKSDAQVAEAVICSEVAKLNGYWPKRPKIAPGAVFKYQVPEFVEYQTPVLQSMLQVVAESDFVIKENGQVQEPDSFNKLKAVKLGSSVYRMGIGGLHSTEESVSYKATETEMLIDRDVASYYPNIILNQRLYPTHMGESFLAVYKSIVDRRLEAKRTKNKVVADSLKIVVNASFGKLGSKWSSLYAPDLMLQVTLSGQLCLLMLIEMIELSGIPVVSGNTDGIIIKCPHDRYEDLNTIIQRWEQITNFETEETRYKAVYSRDINNYIAVKENNSTKLKGAYSKTGLQKNPTSTICNDAVINLITNNIPIEQTITECKNITKFVVARNVKGGGEYKGQYLGKVIRWYYAQKEHATINYVLSGNKVPKSEGANPCMDLPIQFPSDVDYERYIKETEIILYDIAYLKKPSQKSLFNL